MYLYIIYCNLIGDGIITIFISLPKFLCLLKYIVVIYAIVILQKKRKIIRYFEVGSVCKELNSADSAMETISRKTVLIITVRGA